MIFFLTATARYVAVALTAAGMAAKQSTVRR
jgi:hypothetical protein